MEEQQLIKSDYTKPYMQVVHDAMIVAWTSPLSTKGLPGLIREKYAHTYTYTYIIIAQAKGMFGHVSY